jgi:hypothetical protein
LITESLLLKHQLLILNRSRNRAPRLTPWDRLLFGVGAFLVAPNRLPKIAIGTKPATLLRFHRALIQRKYRLLFTPRAAQRPGPKGPSKELIAAILLNGQILRRFVDTPTLTDQYEREQVGRIAYIGVTYTFGSPKKSKTGFEYEQ